MSFPPSIPIETCAVDGINVYWSSHWSSSRLDHRRLIRGHLFRNLESRGFKDIDSILDLTKRPIVLGVGLSISHCQSFGGYAVKFSGEPLGFDIEVSSRVSKKLVSRISSEEEVAESPSFAHLWVAKEAFFKCLDSDRQKSLAFSSLRILDWTAGEGFQIFQAQESGERFRGQVWMSKDERVCFAICQKNSL